MVRTGYLIRAALALTLFVGLNVSAMADRVQDHLQSCPSGDGEKLCEAEKAEFREAFPKAYRGDYQGQRNVAFCLKSGCGGVQRNATLACAWRTVILLSGSSRVDATDQSNFKIACGGLSAAEAATAAAQADRLQRTIRTKR